MTQKEILILAKNPDLMTMLEEIGEINKNMCHKTIYEQKTATNKMKRYAKEIIDTIKQRNAE